MSANRILVVDDERGICESVRKILGKKSFEVTQAFSADEALEKMANESFPLLISDIVMPGKNGLELLKLVKEQWPLTKVLIMTAYASTDTAMKAIRLGALDYIPKPFTPEEIRDKVRKALAGELKEIAVTEKARKSIDVIGLDIPFDKQEVARVTGEDYVNALGPSDMPVVEVPAPETLEFYCRTGDKVCDIYKKLGATCKAGLKSNLCPQARKGKGKQASSGGQGAEIRKLIGIDMPFHYEEVVAVTGPEYVMNLQGAGYSFMPYEMLKERVTAAMKRDVIDADVPFRREEVARAAGDSYADGLGPSDMPAAAAPSPGTLEHYCQTGARVCDIFKKLGAVCKAGLKGGKCPQAKANKKKGATGGEASRTRRLIGPDMPFDYEEVVAVTGPEYVGHLRQGGSPGIPYEELKEGAAKLQGKARIQGLKGKTAPTDLLVIDDEVAVNNNILRILSKKGYSVDQAMTKEEALERIEGKRYRCVLLDLKMPGVRGLELLSAIREKSPDTLVLIVTGYASIESAVESARLGAIGYLPKPFTPEEIRNATEQALRLAA